MVTAAGAVTTGDGQMGFLDKAKDLIADNADKVDDAIDKAADLADDRTGGKHTGNIDKAADAAKDFVEGLDDGKA